MPGKLSTYQAKRNFGVTPEPRGNVTAPQEELRFVVQKHHARKLHYDFRLECDGTLKSWAVPRGPSLDPKDKRLAVHVEDHPLDYIHFEGEIPERQYGAGHVEVWDTGTWEPDGDPAEAYRQGKIKFRLHGEKLHGGWTLVRTRLQASSDKEQWLLIKEKDDEARAATDFDVTAALPDSVLQRNQEKRTASDANAAPKAAARKTSAGTTASKEKKTGARKQSMKQALPEMVSPQLATLVDAIPQEGDWLYEVKYDGYRLLARVEGRKVQLLTRDGKDWTERLPRQAKAIAELGLKSAWLDGEIVVLDEEGVPSFQQLQQSFDEHMSGRIVYFAFDLLYCDGADLRGWPLSERRARLEQILGRGTQEVLRYSTTLDQPPQQLLEGACSLSMEGIIGKRVDSVYAGKRSTDWIKLKCRRRQEFVIAGYTDPQGARQHFGALLLGVYGEDGKLQYAGRVGTGFDRTVLQATYEKLRKLEQEDHPFGKRPSGVTARGVHWIKPSLVAEVSFTEWTQGGILRHAVFHGLRLDKRPRDIRREEATSMAVIQNGEGSKGSDSAPSSPSQGKRGKTKATGNDEIAGVRITHPDRVVDPASGLTKRAVAQYYADIAPWLLPWMKSRPAYLLRCPEGVEGERFFQKHSGRMVIPGIHLLDPALDPEHPPLLTIDTVEGLVGAAQMGTIELHIPGATVERFDRPDYMVFDLDPDPDLAWKRIVEAATLTRVLLEELGLTCFLKTSGSKGLHIVVPLARRHAWADVTAFSEAVTEHLAQTVPAYFSAKMGSQNRRKKIFIDYLRNQPKASTVAPYSARARPSLPVSMPIGWDELPELRGAADWTIETAVQRLASQKSDPWAEFDATRQTITVAMKRKLGLG
jgi:bifunctional non-homologous end joining protein LigD